MVTSFARAVRSLTRGRTRWGVWAAIIVVPLLVMGVLTWAFTTPDGNHGTATAAVVNNDRPVTVRGQIIPLGRVLSANLTHSADSAYTWVLTDARDARAGLADGHYTAVVTIPPDFSARATSTGTAPPLDATRAMLRVQTSIARGVVDPARAAQTARTTEQALNTQIVETYLDKTYIGFTTIHDQLAQAADGVRRLADGTAQLDAGSGQLAGGADQLAAGTAQLAAGSGQLAAGLAKAQHDTAGLPALTRQLAAGAAQVAAGNEQLAAQVVPLANRVLAIIGALPSATEAAARLTDLASRCTSQGGSAQFCHLLTVATGELTQQASTIDSFKATVRAAVIRLRDAVSLLASGARQVANGNARFAAAMPALVDGISRAATGARKLDTGMRAADAGAHRLAAGTRQLHTGIGQVANGLQQMADQMANGRNQIPHYTAAERAHLKSVAAQPIGTTGHTTPASALAIPLVAVLALWTLALATYVYTRAVPGTVLTARAPTWRIILRAALPGAAVATIAALITTTIAVPALHLTLARALAFGLVTLIAAWSFTALNQSALALLGRNGRHVSLTVLLVTAATGILSTLPGPLYTLSTYLPTYGAVLALRAAATGSPGLVAGLTQLVACLAAGMLATIVITDRRRYRSPRQLRRAALSTAS